ncbi:MAG: adenylyltransferase/cytidyltransferase family protein [Candidatus Paceibacterota bacterium]
MEPAKIVSFEEFETLRPKLGTIVCTSGGFDPIHPGHLSCIYDSKRHGDVVVVIVNGDNFLRNKKGQPFMDLDTRCRIVSYVRGVDYVIPFEIENDSTVCVALEKLKPHIFTKGGDRINEKSIPEWKTCEKHGIKIISGVGLRKDWSSSDFLKKWIEFWHSKIQSA